MRRRFAPSARWRRTLSNGAAGVAVASVIAIGLGIDDSVVTQVAARTTGIWLPVEGTGELVLIDPATGVATNRILVTEPNTPVEVIDTDPLVGVVERSSGNMVVVDPALGVVSGRAPLGVSDVTDLIVAGAAWVVGSAGVARVPVDGSQPEVIGVGGPSTGAAAAPDGVTLVIDDARVDVSEGGASDPGPQHLGLAVANVGAQVATVIPDEESVRLDDGKSTCIDGDVGRETVWGGSVTGRGVVVGADGAAGTLHVSLVDDHRCRTLQLIDEPEQPSTFTPPLVVDEVLYISDTTTGRLHIVDLDSDREISVGIFRPGEPVELIFHQGDVIAHEPRTFAGAVVGPRGVRQLIDKSAGRPLVNLASDNSPVVVGRGDVAVESVGAETGDGFSADLIIDDPVVLGTGEVSEPLEEAEELVANFAFSAARVQVGVAVVFVDASTGDPRSWTWDFGDGTNASGPRVAHFWSEPGTYQVTLFVDREDASDSRSALIEVVPEETLLAPTADFEFSDFTVAVNESVTFTDVSVGDVTARRWDFGDGSGGVDVEVSKSWPAPGSYTVTLTVANDAGADSASATITVVDRLVAPTAVIDVDAVEVEVGEPVRLRSVSTGDISRVRWDFGDGGSDSASEVVHTYAVEGSYTVTLTVSNSAGSSSASEVITVKATTLPPEARIAALTTTTIETGKPTTLTSLSLNDPDTLEWEFGDGSTGSGTPVTHTWTQAGTYVVTLTATNESGSDTATVVVVVLPYLPPPIASFVSPATIRVGTPAEFVNTSSNGTSFLWDFGDGGSATTVPAIHTYLTPGTTVVTLTVTNRNGTATATDTVNVLPALPVAGFTSSPVAVRVNESVFFTSTSTGAVTHAWNFGDGATSVLPSPSHAYLAAGDYPVTLTVTNSIGETDQANALISVDPAAPSLSPITADPTPGVTLSLVTFTVTPAVGSGPIVNYTWDFGDGGAATTVVGSATHTYVSAGTYNVSVSAAGVLPGDVATSTVVFNVNDPPPPIITMSVSPPTPELNQVATLTATPGVGSGPINSYSWDFGDGTFATGAVVTHAWGSIGPKLVKVTAFGPVATATAMATVTIVPPPPPVIVAASASPSPALTGEVVNFSATLGATSGPVDSWSWDFGDGGSSNQQNPPYTYTVASPPGGYTVKVTATGPVVSDTFIFTLEVNVPPPLLTAPTFTPIVPLAGDTVTFSVGPAAGSGPITSYLWTFHDSTTSTLPSPSYTYPAAGSYAVSVSASGPGGTTGPIPLVVHVYDPISADFSTSQPGGAGSSVVFFTDQSTGAPAVSWFWDFGDGGTSTAQNPTHPFFTAGDYNVTLTVTDAMGRFDSRSRIVTVL